MTKNCHSFSVQGSVFNNRAVMKCHTFFIFLYRQNKSKIRLSVICRVRSTKKERKISIWALKYSFFGSRQAKKQDFGSECKRKTSSINQLFITVYITGKKPSTFLFFLLHLLTIYSRAFLQFVTVFLILLHQESRFAGF